MKPNQLIFLLLFIVVCVSAQTSDKDKAKAVYLEILDCYFKKDCAKFYTYFNDSVKIFSVGDNFISSKKLVEKKAICSKFDSIIYKTKTKENYLQKYSIDVFSYKEFSTINSKSMDDYFSEYIVSKGAFVLADVNYHKKLYTQNDFLVIGDIPADGKYESGIGARYIFMLRKTAKGLKIVSFR